MSLPSPAFCLIWHRIGRAGRPDDCMVWHIYQADLLSSGGTGKAQRNPGCHPGVWKRVMAFKVTNVNMALGWDVAGKPRSQKETHRTGQELPGGHCFLLDFQCLSTVYNYKLYIFKRKTTGTVLWAELFPPTHPNPYVGVPTPRTSECDCIRRWGSLKR